MKYTSMAHTRERQNPMEDIVNVTLSDLIFSLGEEENQRAEQPRNT